MHIERDAKEYSMLILIVEEQVSAGKTPLRFIFQVPNPALVEEWLLTNGFKHQPQKSPPADHWIRTGRSSVTSKNGFFPGTQFSVLKSNKPLKAYFAHSLELSDAIFETVES